MITKQTIIKEQEIYYNLKKATIKNYYYALLKYEETSHSNIDKLLQEATEEEETITKKNKRKIKQRLQNFILTLLQEDYTVQTIIIYTSIIQKIYRHYDIELPDVKMPRNTQPPEEYEDIPTKKHIIKAINNSKIKMKAIITFIASSGLSRSDATKLTIQDFITATKQYHNTNNIIQLLQELDGRTIIPVWRGNRIKNNTSYITCSSPESTQYILDLLKERLMKQELDHTDSLFDITRDGLTQNFNNLNNRLHFGKKLTRNFFHAHALRMFFATTLNIHRTPFIVTEFMLGHKIDNSTSTYYKANVRQIVEEYKRVLPYLSFNENVSYVDVSSSDKQELEDLKKQLRDYEDMAVKMRHLEEVVNNLSRLK